MNVIQENIDNLTGLWKLAGQTFQGYGEDRGIHSAEIPDTQWPNKIWTDQPLSENLVQQLGQKMRQNPRLTLSYFNPDMSEDPLFDAHGYQLLFNQYGMSLPLLSKFEVDANLVFKRVANPHQAAQWSDAFESAFGYYFGAETLVRTMESVPYYLVFHQQELVGTVILYTTGKVAGLHALGIVPEKRKQGHATKIMHWALNKAMDYGCSLATLQASPMAQSMYLKMGFTTNFVMQNYKLA